MSDAIENLKKLEVTIESRAWTTFWVLFVFWFFLTVSFLLFVIWTGINKAEIAFNRDASELFQIINEKIRVNDAVMEGIAAQYEIAGDQGLYTVASEYARRILEAYPHIYMIEAVRRVPKTELRDLEFRMRHRYPNFAVRNFAYTSSREWHEVEDKPYYYPIVFIEPVLTEAREVLGLDIGSVDFLREAMIKSIQQQSPAASRPFTLVEGDRAYVVFRPIHSDDNLFAMLVVKAEALIRTIGSRISSISLSLEHTDFAHNSDVDNIFTLEQAPRSYFERLVFPRFEFFREIENTGQPFRLTVNRQIGWEIIDPDLLYLTGFTSTAVLALIMLYIRVQKRFDSERAVHHQQMFYLANYDTLTGLPNRNLFHDRLKQALSRARRMETCMGLLFLDLDRFKEVNDTYGHETGDRLLKLVAQRFQACYRKVDSICRFAGDEFVILLENIDGESAIHLVENKLRKCLSEPFLIDGNHISVTASIGSAMYPKDAEDIRGLLRKSDSVMYERKRFVGR